MLHLSLSVQTKKTNVHKHTARQFVAEVATVIDAVTAVRVSNTTTVVTRKTI